MAGRAATKRKIPGRYALSVGLTDMPAPPGWAWTGLRNIARLETGHTPSRGVEDYWNGDIPWIGIKDARVHHGKVINETLQSVTQEGLDNSAARLLPAQTVCLSRTASVGYVLIMGKPMATSQDFVDWICSEAIDPRFLMHLLIAEKESLFKFGKGTTHTTIYFPEVKAFHVCVPPRPEQRRIVTKLEALQQRTRRARAALDAIPPLLEKFRQSVLAAAFRGDLTGDWRARNPDVEPASVLLERIRKERRRRWEEAELAKMKAKGKVPKDDQWKGRYDRIARKASRGQLAEIKARANAASEAPKGWELVPLGEVINLQPGYAFKSKWFSKNGVRLLRGTNIVPGGTRWADTVHLPYERLDEFPNYLLRQGDVVIAMDRPIISAGLKVAQLSADDVPALLLQRVGRFELEHGVDPAYLLHFLNSHLFISHITGQATGTQLPHVSQNDIEAVLCPIPPVEEQRRIIDRLKAVLDRATCAQAKLQFSHDHLGRLESSILAKAFRGDLVPQDPDDEPAAKLLERIRAARPEKPARRTRRAPKPRPAPPQPAIEPPPEPAPPTEPQPDATDLRDPLHRALLGRGPLERDAAIREAASALRDTGTVDYRRLRRGGPLYRSLDAAVDAALATGLLDQPNPGEVRAVLENPRDYTPENWRHVLLACLGHDPADRAEAIEASAYWAAENLGLHFQRLRRDGVIARGLEAALEAAIRRGEIKRVGSSGVSRVALTPEPLTP